MEPIGTVAGPKDGALAIETARRYWADEAEINGYALRAIPWSSATADQREAATYEDGIRAQLQDMDDHWSRMKADLEAMSTLVRGRR